MLMLARHPSATGLRSAVFIATLLLGPVAAAAPARADDDALYRARAFVTGQGESERARGMALCLADVLVKVSGDPQLRGDARLKPLESEAARLVARFSYHDRMAGLPLHDEQGTRDRPFDLTVAFDPGRIDGALRSLGLQPWPLPRPAVMVLLGIRDGAGVSYVLAGNGGRGLGQRLSLAAAGERSGLPVRLPDSAGLAARQLTYEELAAATPARLKALSRSFDGAPLLAGRLDWDEAAGGWNTRWRFSGAGKERDWQIRGVSFDEDFRRSVDRTMGILSGHER
ncbi:MAG TPA: DUF2066 domain-containing protein [Stellaceae bacterium]|nr:DUF2066 domain-containing protein [Stellaceae bacterium]